MAAQSDRSYSDDVPGPGIEDESSLKPGNAASVSPSAGSPAPSENVFRHRTVIKVNRPVYTQLEFKENYNFTTEDRSETISQQLLELVKKQCTPSLTSLLSFFPFISIMRQYSLRRDLFSDIIAGLTVGIMHIPQGQHFCIVPLLSIYIVISLVVDYVDYIMIIIYIITFICHTGSKRNDSKIQKTGS